MSVVPGDGLKPHWDCGRKGEEATQEDESKNLPGNREEGSVSIVPTHGLAPFLEEGDKSRLGLFDMICSV